MELTRDAIFEGRLPLWQPRPGYRFNLDPILLAGFARPAASVIDLGAGCGVLGLALMVMGKAHSLTLVEILPEMAALATRNIDENAFADKARVVNGDLRSLVVGPAEHVVFNPPYFEAARGRGAASDSRDVGRHERNGGLADFVGCAWDSLTDGGFASAIVPVGRGDELRAAWTARGGTVRRAREVCSRAGDPPRHLLFEGVKGASTPVHEQPLVVHRDGARDYSAEVAEWLAGRG